MSRDLILLMICGLFAFTSCKSDNEEKIDYNLEGKWDVYEAYRNKALTTTLEDGYFHFQDSILETNIIGSPISGKYILEGNSFQHESELPVDYALEYYSSDTLHLRTEIQGFRFLFKLTRALESAEKDQDEENL